MIPALIVTNAAWLLLVLMLLIAARLDILSGHVRRPTRARKPKEAGNG